LTYKTTGSRRDWTEGSRLRKVALRYHTAGEARADHEEEEEEEEEEILADECPL